MSLYATLRLPGLSEVAHFKNLVRFSTIKGISDARKPTLPQSIKHVMDYAALAFARIPA
jgi:hypothetical protein